MNFQIEMATENNVSQILAMIHEFAAFENLSEFCEVTEDDLRDAMFGKNPALEGLIALSEKEPVGYALFFPNFSSFRGTKGFYLEDIFVKPEYRGQKIGEFLIKKLAQIAKQRNFQRIDFLVLDWNESAIKFYKKFGAEADESERHFKFTDQAFSKLTD